MKSIDATGNFTHKTALNRSSWRPGHFLARAFLLVLIMLILSINTAYAIPKRMNAIKGTPIIDGKIDEIWSKAETIDVKTKSFTFTTYASPVTAKVKTLWDEDNLYCLAEINDPVLSGTLGHDPWERDSIEFLVDQSMNREEGHHFDEHGGHYRVDALEGTLSGRYEAYELAVRNGTASACSVVTDYGYLVEIAMPWSTLKGKVKPGVMVGFQVAINDDPGKGRRDGIVLWNGEDAWSVAHTWKLGDLRLTDENGLWDIENPDTGDMILLYCLCALAALFIICGQHLFRSRKRVI